MKRKMLMVLLAFGTIGGFTAGIASVACRAHHGRAHWEHRWKHEVTKVCSEAMRPTQQEEKGAQ